MEAILTYFFVCLVPMCARCDETVIFTYNRTQRRVVSGEVSTVITATKSIVLSNLSLARVFADHVKTNSKNEKAIPEICETELHECDKTNGECISIQPSTPGLYRCACKAGFNTSASYRVVGTSSTPIPTPGISCPDINECTNAERICATGNCTNTDGSFNCICPQGYDFNGAACQDVDECVVETQPCPENTECVNTEGSYTCICPPGTTYIPPVCFDISECKGNHSCSNNSVCINTYGSYSCLCRRGFTGDGFTCTELLRVTSREETVREAAFIATCGAIVAVCYVGTIFNFVAIFWPNRVTEAVFNFLFKQR